MGREISTDENCRFQIMPRQICTMELRYETFHKCKKYDFLEAILPAYGRSEFLDCVRSLSHRRAMAGLLLSDHPLEVERDRHLVPAVARSNRLCRWCLKIGIRVVGDENHALDLCPQHLQDRSVCLRSMPFCGPPHAQITGALLEVDGYEKCERVTTWLAVSKFAFCILHTVKDAIGKEPTLLQPVS